MLTDAELHKGLMTMNVIWFAMLFSLAVYLLGAKTATGGNII